MELTKQQVNTILQNAPSGADKTKILDGLVKRGYKLEGVDSNQVLKSLQPKQPVNQDQMSPEQADKFLNKSTVGQIFSKETAQELPKAAYETLVGNAAKFVKSAVEAPVNIVQGLQGKEMTTANINDPVTGKPIGSFQTDFQNKILPAVESGQISPLKGTVQAVGGPILGAADVLGAGELVSGGTKLVKTGAEKVSGAVDNLITDSKTLADDLIAKSQPKVTLEQATGQIIQGKTGDVKQAVQAIGAVDTTGVKTYKDLLGKFKEKKPELLSVVDNELAKDTTQYSLDNLSTTVATNSGKTVSTNYVDTALKDLRELYSTTGDVKQLANLEELAAKGSYTLKEVNDISRVYNSEFGQKAFSKLGDPLTSVNAQRFENTRKGLKDVARRGIGGAEAKKADELLSSVYNTENLVKRNMEAVNKLRQRINERGLFEKAGHYITKYADILTGGTIRGAVAGLLPRGAGYKVLNALDLEEQLAKNLDIINKALTSKSDDIIVNQLKSLDLPIKNSTSKATPSMGAKTSTSKLNTTNDASLNSSIPTVSKKNGIMSSDLSTGVKKAFNDAKDTLKTLKDKNVRERGSISLESILPESKSVRNQGVSLAKNTTEDLVQQAKKYKSAEEFVKVKYPEINLSIYEKGNEITLSKIIVPKETRGSGIGTKAMEDLIKYADNKGKKIVLTPSKDYGASSVSRLTGFYKRFGFVENKGKFKDFSTRELMYRLPKN